MVLLINDVQKGQTVFIFYKHGETWLRAIGSLGTQTEFDCVDTKLRREKRRATLHTEQPYTQSNLTHRSCVSVDKKFHLSLQRE